MNKDLIMGEKEQIQEADTRLYTRDLVIQDCNSYIKQVIYVSFSQVFLITSFLVFGEE